MYVLQVCTIGVEKTKLQCDHCGDCFKTRTTLIKHLTKHGAPIPEELKKRPYNKRVKVEPPQDGSTEVANNEEVTTEIEGQEVQIVTENGEQVVQIETDGSHPEDIVQHALQLQEIQQGGGDAAILLQRIASRDGEEAEALETALQLVQLEFIPGPSGGGTAPQAQTIQVVTEDGTTVEETAIVQEVQEHAES